MRAPSSLYETKNLCLRLLVFPYFGLISAVVPPISLISSYFIFAHTVEFGLEYLLPSYSWIQN